MEREGNLYSSTRQEGSGEGVGNVQTKHASRMLDEDAFSELLGSRNTVSSPRDEDGKKGNGVHSTVLVGTGQQQQQERASQSEKGGYPMVGMKGNEKSTTENRDYLLMMMEGTIRKVVKEQVGAMLEKMERRLDALDHRVEQIQQMVGDVQEVGAVREDTAKERYAELEKMLRDVQRLVQIVRDRAELAEASAELSKLTFADTSGGKKGKGKGARGVLAKVDEQVATVDDVAYSGNSSGGDGKAARYLEEERVVEYEEEEHEEVEEGEIFVSSRFSDVDNGAQPRVERGYPAMSGHGQRHGGRRAHDRQHSLDSTGSYSSLQAPALPSSPTNNHSRVIREGQSMGRYNGGYGDQGKYTCLPDIYPPSQPIHGRDNMPVGPPPVVDPPRTGPVLPPPPHNVQMGHRPQPPSGHVVGHMHPSMSTDRRQPPPPPPPTQSQTMPKPPPPPVYHNHMIPSEAGYPPPNMGPSYSAGAPQHAGAPEKPVPGGQPTSVPIEKVIDDISVMGFSREEVRNVLRELTAQGKAVDMNIVLDRLGAR